MYAVIARLVNNCEEYLLGFANSQEEIDEMIDRFIDFHGADYLGDAGCRFDIELAA